MTRPIVVMGPSGNGKSALGTALAARLGLPFVEGDDCHPPANVARMARGEPLTDADRAPFLANVAAALMAHPGGAVAACSALKRAYRDTLRAAVPGVVFVLPLVPADVLAARMAARPGHFMPASLLASQLATLEMPGDDEAVVTVDGTLPLPDLVRTAEAELAG